MISGGPTEGNFSKDYQDFAGPGGGAGKPAGKGLMEDDTVHCAFETTYVMNEP